MKDPEVLVLAGVALLAVFGMAFNTTGAVTVPTGVDPAWYAQGVDMANSCIEDNPPHPADWRKCCSYKCEDTCTEPDCQYYCRYSCENELTKQQSLFYTE